MGFNSAFKGLKHKSAVTVLSERLNTDIINVISSDSAHASLL